MPHLFVSGACRLTDCDVIDSSCSQRRWAKRGRCKQQQQSDERGPLASYCSTMRPLISPSLAAAASSSSSASSLSLSPKGCDTFVALPPYTSPPGAVIFGKNSDRPSGEGQTVQKYDVPSSHPKASSKEKEDATDSSGDVVQCTYIAIPQVHKRYATIISQIDWMYGAEMGANECGVVIGNEAVWTVVPQPKDKALLGMDLVRLGLERGATARQALATITELLERYGQGGPCAENDASFTYDNSFLLADPTPDAWVLETAGRHWVAKQVKAGYCNISNGLTIRTDFDLCSKGLKEYAKQIGAWDESSEFDWAECFSSGGVELSPFSRQVCGANLLRDKCTGEETEEGKFDVRSMMAILRDHNSGICMHGAFETTSSMVSELRKGKDGPSSSSNHWFTGQPHPCQCEFKVEEF